MSKKREVQNLITFSNESSLGDTRITQIPIAVVTAIPKRRFVSAFSQLSCFPEHEELLAKTGTNQLLVHVRAVQLAWGKKPSFFSSDGSNSAHHCPWRKACLRKASLLRKRCLDCQRWIWAVSLTAKLKAFLFDWDWELRESFVVSHFRSVHRWLHALQQYRFTSIHCTWARSGETEFAISHFLAAFEVRAKGESKRSFRCNSRL